MELTVLMKLMLRRQAHQNSVIFVTIGTYKGLRFKQMSEMDAMIY